MKNFWIYLCCTGGLVLAGCDLQPKITSLPDSVGDFISVRYPALLADPNTQPEIYNSAASDYGVYASPELYGSVSKDDYVLYSSVSDYIIPPQADATVKPADTAEKTVANTSGTEDGKSENPVPAVDKTTDTVNTLDKKDADNTDTPTDDYLMVPMYGAMNFAADENAPDTVIVARGDTLYSIARANNTTIAELVRINKLDAPSSLSVGQVLRVRDASANAMYVAVPATDVKAAAPAAVQATEQKSVVIKNPTPTTTKVELQQVTVEQGDTLYSISRRYSVPVNDLAVMNDISAPFGLRTGQVLKVPNLSSPTVRVATSVETPKPVQLYGNPDAIVVKTASPVTTPGTEKKVVDGGTGGKDTVKTTTQNATTTSSEAAKKNTASQKTNTAEKPQVKEKQKISSDPSKKLPKIAARSSSKFTWPVRGKVLSHFGAKSQGLFNDGINISATRGTAVGAAENGVVAYAGNEVKGMGNLVIVQHADGWMTVYAHLDSMNVRRGAKVSVGQKIGTVGATGRVDTPQLHFETRKGTKAYDPVKYLKK